MPHGVHTGNMLTEEKADSIIDQLAQGSGIIRTAAIVHSSSHTVQAVRDANPERLQERKREIAENLMAFATRGSRVMADSVSEFQVKDLPIAVAVAIDKVLLLSGEPTSHVQHTHTLDVSTLSSRLSSIPRLKVITEATVSPVPVEGGEGAETGVGGGKE